eukprot:6203793-Pleurochrysis_carterae.AAC.1
MIACASAPALPCTCERAPRALCAVRCAPCVRVRARARARRTSARSSAHGERGSNVFLYARLRAHLDGRELLVRANGLARVPARARDEREAQRVGVAL